MYIKIAIKLQGQAEELFIQDLSKVNKDYTFSTISKIKERVHELGGTCKIKINNNKEGVVYLC